MKPLSKTLTELGIAFGFPIIIEDANGKVTYREDSDDNWVKWEFDANGNETYYEDSNGNWGKWEFDANGKVTYFEDCDGYWGRYERDVKGRPTYHEGSNGFWQRWERDANGDFLYYEDSTGVKKGTPKSAKAYITLDREETILFADILKAASKPPTPEFKRALRAYRDFIIKHK